MKSFFVKITFLLQLLAQIVYSEELRVYRYDFLEKVYSVQKEAPVLESELELFEIRDYIQNNGNKSSGKASCINVQPIKRIDFQIGMADIVKSIGRYFCVTYDSGVEQNFRYIDFSPCKYSDVSYVLQALCLSGSRAKLEKSSEYPSIWFSTTQCDEAILVGNIAFWGPNNKLFFSRFTLMCFYKGQLVKIISPEVHIYRINDDEIDDFRSVYKK